MENSSKMKTLLKILYNKNHELRVRFGCTASVSKCVLTESVFYSNEDVFLAFSFIFPLLPGESRWYVSASVKMRSGNLSYYDGVGEHCWHGMWKVCWQVLCPLLLQFANCSGTCQYIWHENTSKHLTQWRRYINCRITRQTNVPREN